MTSIFRLLIAIPMALCRFIWQVFWGLFKIVLVIAILAFGLNYYAEHSQSAFAQSIFQVKERLINVFDQTSAQSLKETLSHLSTDDFVAYEGARWTYPKATVYMDSSDATIVAAYQEALANWNATGVFTFTLVADKAQAQIVLTDHADSSTQAAGLAELKTNSLTNHISHVDVTLNTYYLLNGRFGYSYERIVNTAEHELGHAIGLAHDDSEDSVMQSSGSYYGIQAVDIEAVRRLYA
ncbi:M57 family metalloprotease [Streptococcus sp. zg-JUN1979]|uniref:M57 family metalloprotease n=1 Tax=Streptococcus sp. zg-JUN1979 TaxID=3391450 RepID=UPI0039A6555F